MSTIKYIVEFYGVLEGSSTIGESLYSEIVSVSKDVIYTEDYIKIELWKNYSYIRRISYMDIKLIHKINYT